MKAWSGLLVFQILVGANAGLVFNFLPRGWAGLVAGLAFCLFGVVALRLSWKHSLKFRTLNIFISGVFLGLSLPMAVTRVMTPFDRPVTEVLGGPLKIYHDVSTYLFAMVFLLGLVQLTYAIKFRKVSG